MEMVFRKIEIWIEGNPKQRRKLDEGGWTNEKIWKKSLKHMLFLLLSFVIANTFLAYIIGSENLIRIITEPVNAHLSGFVSILIFTTVFYLVYSWVREIVCTVICPYGRLQGVLTDASTLQVAYNYLRGEPRGKRSRNTEANTTTGDCVDCGLCVDVCPTGIDIRNGIQLECVNCTACIDACNDVMIKINRDINLIGFYSEQTIKQKAKPAFTLRMAMYSGIVVLLLAVLSFFIIKRSDVDITVLRSAGLLYQEQPDGFISNVYSADLINKTNTSQQVELRATNADVKIKYIQPLSKLGKEESARIAFFLMIPAEKIRMPKTEIKLKVMHGNKELGSTTTTFTGPINAN